MQQRDFYEILFAVGIPIGVGTVAALLMLIGYLTGQTIRSSDRLTVLGWSAFITCASAWGTARELQEIKLEIPISDRAAFTTRLNIALSELGYRPEIQTETFSTYSRGGPIEYVYGLLGAGKLRIQVEGGVANLVGRKKHLHALRTRLSGEQV